EVPPARSIPAPRGSRPLSDCHGDSREDLNVRLLWTSSCEGFLHDSREDVDTGFRPRPPEQSPDVEWAQLAENAGDIAGAERLYRVLMNCDPPDAAATFNPANLFWATTARLKPKRRCVRPRALIRRSRKLGTIFPTCWTS